MSPYSRGRIMLYARIILLSDKGRQPLTRRVEIQSIEDYIANKKYYQERAILSLCKSRALTPRHLEQYGYTKVTVKFEYKEN